MSVSLLDLQLAFDFVSSGAAGENEAYLDRQSGKIYWHSEFSDNDKELPDDIDDEKYIAIPDKRELELGKPLVLDFAREFLPDDYDEVRHIFSRRGACRRCKDLLVRRGALETVVRFFEQGRGSDFAGVVRAERDRTQRDLRFILLLSTDGFDESAVRRNRFNSLLSSETPVLRSMMRIVEPKARIQFPAKRLRTIGSAAWTSTRVRMRFRGAGCQVCFGS